MGVHRRIVLDSDNFGLNCLSYKVVVCCAHTRLVCQFDRYFHAKLLKLSFSIIISQNKNHQIQIPSLYDADVTQHVKNHRVCPNLRLSCEVRETSYVLECGYVSKSARSYMGLR